MDGHNYDADITSYTEHMHGWMNQSGKAAAELWLSEWGMYVGGYQSASTGVNTVLNNLIRGARPGHGHIDGSHPSLNNGHVTFTIPPTAAILVTF
jgi:hypothetical protein